jgi:hypothetical protein
LKLVSNLEVISSAADLPIFCGIELAVVFLKVRVSPQMFQKSSFSGSIRHQFHIPAAGPLDSSRQGARPF